MPPPRTRTSTQRGAPIVVKADGLAAGKGVVVAQTRRGGARGDRRDAGRQCDGRGRRARRHRGVPRRRGGELHRHGRRPATCCRSPRRRTTSGCATATTGPNTGGMGAYSPAPVVTPALHARIMREVILPAVERHGRRRHSVHRIPVRGRDDRRRRQSEGAGVQLPAGRSRKRSRSWCGSSPISSISSSTAVNGTLDRVEAEWDRRAALGVVLAARGYPDSPRHGRRHRRPRPRDAGHASRRARSSTPGTRAGSAARSSSPAGACCASRRSAIRCGRRSAPRTRRSPKSSSPACSTAATSAIARLAPRGA